METKKIKIPFTSRMQVDLRETFGSLVKLRGASIEDALEEAVISWCGNVEEDSSPLSRLSKKERAIAEGLIIGLRAKDRQMESMAEVLKILIEEKGYEYKAKTPGESHGDKRSKVAG